MRWLLFCASSLFATVNEPLRCTLFTGYRNDRIHWHLQESGEGSLQTYSELDRNVQFWDNGIALKVIHRDLTFFLRGSYGAFGKGEAFQKISNLPGTDVQPQYTFATNGWAADVSGYFGYAVNLTADRVYKVILTPLIGYAGYFERLTRSCPVAQEPELASFSASLPGDFSLTWNGFLFGAGFTVEPGSRLIFHAGYAYNLMHNRTKTSLETTYQGTTTTQQMSSSSDGNPGQAGWASFDFILPKLWRIGLGGNIHYFSTRVVDANVASDAQKLKLRWTSVAGWLQISKEL